jgi:type IV secretion system protein VirB8
MSQPIDAALASNQARSKAHPSKGSKKAVDDYLNEIKAFESDRVALAQSSAKTAWKVATGAGLVAILALLAVVMLTPIKAVEPYLLKVDNATGYADVVRPLKDAEGISYGEVLDKYWLNQFVITRNGYEWETIQSSYNTMKLMTNAKVFGAYTKTVLGEKSLAKVFSDKKSMRIEVQGITFLPSTDKYNKLAQVRFVRHVETDKGEDDRAFNPTHWTATLSFDYDAIIRTEDERRLNPLSFRVTSYREDRVIE